MRGKVQKFIKAGFGWRITPAYAGKSFVYSCYGAFNRDHPRVCGEKESLHSVPVMRVGSPPRMRGKD